MEITLSGGGAPLGIIECRYAVNTNSAGASISADTWTALAITEFLDTGGHCSVSAGVMTLQAGTYRGFIECTRSSSGVPSYTGMGLRLRNTSDSVSPILTSGYTIQYNSQVVPTLNEIGTFVIGSSKNFELQILLDNALTLGFALSGTLNDPDQHQLAKVYLEKIA